MGENSYATTSRKNMQNFLEQNRDRTVTASDIDAYLRENNCEVNITTIY